MSDAPLDAKKRPDTNVSANKDDRSKRDSVERAPDDRDRSRRDPDKRDSGERAPDQRDRSKRDPNKRDRNRRGSDARNAGKRDGDKREANKRATSKSGRFDGRSYEVDSEGKSVRRPAVQFVEVVSLPTKQPDPVVRRAPSETAEASTSTPPAAATDSGSSEAVSGPQEPAPPATPDIADSDRGREAESPPASTEGTVAHVPGESGRQPEVAAEQVKAQRLGVIVRYGRLRHYEVFETIIEDLDRRQHVVVETRRGLEIGDVRRRPKNLAKFGDESVAGSLIRLATPEDLRRWRQIQAQPLDEHRRFCRERITARDLVMSLTDVEPIFGGDKVVFYFTADKRVDFRDLVKDLARRFRTRIEMRQIGARDDAKLLGDVGPCGQTLCCTRHIRTFDPVSMKMAKNQRTTLDPSKISGVCGRLKCCLRYEDSQYTDIKREMPCTGCTCKLKQAGVGNGGREPGRRTPMRVLGQSLLTRTVLVTSEENGKQWFPLDELEWDPKNNLADHDDATATRKSSKQRKAQRKKATQRHRRDATPEKKADGKGDRPGSRAD